MKSNLSDIYFIQDIFREEYLGGAECNDHVLLNHLSNEYSIEKIKSSLVTKELLKSIEDRLIIFSNFTMMSPDAISYATKNNRYIIYEHDHKYIKTRDPSKFKNFKIPKNSIINHKFYINAHAVVVLSKVCKEILENNLELENVYSIGCSLWSKTKFDFLRSLTLTPKEKKYAVLNSNNPIKGRVEALNLCKKKNLEFDLIGSDNEKDFLKQLASFETLIFLPQVLETFSRLAAEAKMLNCNLLTKAHLLGFYSEECSILKGDISIVTGKH